MLKLIIFILYGKITGLKADEREFKEFAINTELKEASENGKNIILKGGNAIDAAITAALTIGVINSFSSGIGGGGFLLYMQNQGDQKQVMFDFREKTAEEIDIDMLITNPTLRTTTGHSVAVPSEVLGLYKAHKKYGKLPWKELFTDVIKNSEGFPASKLLIKKIKKNYNYIKQDEGLSGTFLKNGNIPNEGDIIIRKNYAETLKIIANNPLDFYSGKLADQIVKFLKSKNSNIQLSDLKNYRVKRRKIISGEFYNYKIITTNLPSSGIFIVEALNILERLNLKILLKLINNENIYIFYHLMIELMKFISSSKENFGDPDYLKNYKDQINYLLSEKKTKEFTRMFQIDRVLNYKEINFKNQLAEDHGTTHLNVVDRENNIVSLTTTINMEFGSKMMDPITGIIFNNHVNDFYFPESKNINTPNTIGKNKRPLSSMSPLILMNDYEIIVLGGSGGSRITNSIILFIGYLMSGNSVSESIESCRIHPQMYSNSMLIEPTLNKNIVEKLKKMGHRIKKSRKNTTYSTLQAIQILNYKSDKKIYAISDSRKNGKSDGV